MTQSIASLARRFKRNDRGNVAVMTSVAAVVLLGIAGLALDTIRGESLQTDMADATDAVALILAKSDAKTEGEMRKIADAYLARQFPGEKGARLSVSSIQRNGDAVRVVLKNNYDTSLARVLNRNDVDVSAGATAIYSQKTMDIALVLDTTESMRGTKMAALKSSAGDMVTTIAGYDNANVRMSVVPFSNYVNVGTSRRNAPWLEVPEDQVQSRGPRCRMVSDVISRSGPYQESYSRNVDGNIQTGTRTRYRNVVRGPEREVCDDGWSRTLSWTGCVGSRLVPADTRVAYRGRKIPGIFERCGAELQEMSADLNKVKSTIDALEPQGNTYMPAGLMWGWRTLDSKMPLKVNTKKGTEKVLILMTDGENSVRKVNLLHNDNGGTDPVRMAEVSREANSKTRSICNSIKGDDIVVYTIAYGVADSATRNLLEGCATSRGNFFDAKDAKDLDDAFRDIGASLNQLRITS